MEIINSLSLNNIINFIHSNGLFFSLYTYFIILLLIIELYGLSVINKFILKINKGIKDDIIRSSFSKELIQEYKTLLERQRDLVNTRNFIDNYFLKKGKFKIALLNIIKNSDFIFLFIGLLGAFVITLFGIISINFEVITGFQDLFLQIEELVFVFKPAMFCFILGIISSIINKLLIKAFNLNDRINMIKLRLENYLENNIKYKYNRELKEIKLFEELIETINKGFIRLELSIEDSFNDSFTRIDESIDKYLKLKDQLENEHFHVLENVAITKEEEN